jgi:hypothetical protein
MRVAEVELEIVISVEGVALGIAELILVVV